MKRVVILQPGYLPWIGFFDMMAKADVFVIFDDVQYTVRDWRSRNRIKKPDGVLWLTVPIQSKGSREKLIKDVEVDSAQKWQRNHSKNLQSFYSKTPFFEQTMEMIGDLYEKSFQFLLDVDMDFISKVSHFLGIKAEVCFSSSLPSDGVKDEKLLSICKHLQATHYLSGNAARDYLREPLFNAEGISVEWHNYQHPVYHQRWLKEQGFISHLSIVDLLFNHGHDALDILSANKKVALPEGTQVRTADAIVA